MKSWLRLEMLIAICKYGNQSINRQGNEYIQAMISPNSCKSRPILLDTGPQQTLVEKQTG